MTVPVYDYGHATNINLAAGRSRPTLFGSGTGVNAEHLSVDCPTTAAFKTSVRTLHCRLLRGHHSRAEPAAVAEHMLTLLGTLLDTLVRGFVLPRSTSTILQDWGKSRRSEADDINVLVVNVLHGAGRTSPANAAVVALARCIERVELQTSPSYLDALLSLSAAALS